MRCAIPVPADKIKNFLRCTPHKPRLRVSAHYGLDSRPARWSKQYNPDVKPINTESQDLPLLLQWNSSPSELRHDPRQTPLLGVIPRLDDGHICPCRTGLHADFGVDLYGG